MIGTEILMVRPILQHMVDRRQHRGGYGANGFLRSSPGTESLELRSVVAVLLSRRRPGALDEDGLQPGITLAQARGFPFAGTLVLARTHPGPCEQMSSGWKAAHVAADFRQNDRGAQDVDARHRAQKQDQGPKGDLSGLPLLVHLRGGSIDRVIDLGDRLAQSIVLPEI